MNLNVKPKGPQEIGRAHLEILEKFNDYRTKWAQKRQGEKHPAFSCHDKWVCYLSTVIPTQLKENIWDEIDSILVGSSRPPMTPYHPPHWGALSLNASILLISLLPQRGHSNSFSSLGPNGAGSSKLDWHWWQVSSQVTIISCLSTWGISFGTDIMFAFRSNRKLVPDKFNIEPKDFSVKKKTQ